MDEATENCTHYSGEWDPSIRIEPPAIVPSQQGRKNPNQKKPVIDEEEEEERSVPGIRVIY